MYNTTVMNRSAYIIKRVHNKTKMDYIPTAWNVPGARRSRSGGQ